MRPPCRKGGDDLVVLGRQADTAGAKNWPGHRILGIKDWSIRKDGWGIPGAIQMIYRKGDRHCDAGCGKGYRQVSRSQIELEGVLGVNPEF